jgi:hypothetical protein
MRLNNNKRRKITMDHEMEGFIQESKLGGPDNKLKENRHLNSHHHGASKYQVP